MARQLKGTAASKMKPETKAKKEATLKRMDDNKAKDTVRLRDTITKKIEDLTLQVSKAEEYLSQHRAKIEELEAMKLKIEGALIALKEVSQ